MKTGRRWAIVYGCILVTIGGAMQAAANSSGLMIAGRVIAVSFISSLAGIRH
jgi:MFS family permease